MSHGQKRLGTMGIENHGVHAHSMSNYCLSQNQHKIGLVIILGTVVMFCLMHTDDF